MLHAAVHSGSACTSASEQRGGLAALLLRCTPCGLHPQLTPSAPGALQVAYVFMVSQRAACLPQKQLPRRC